MKTQFVVLLFAGLLLFVSAIYSQPEDTHEQVSVQTTNQQVHPVESINEHTEEHHTDMSPLFFIIIALFIGTATRHFLRRWPVPYTVLLIIFGLLLGIFSRTGLFSVHLPLLDSSLNWAGNIDPHLILFIFLPTLIFEAAFNMDVHTFKKSFTNSLILAVPGILVALALTAVVIMGIVYSGIGLMQWDWIAALMFGALISATDPVSVVALLKELGVSKKLSTLIDGESILNDGTAIVLFMVFLLPLTGEASDVNPFLSFLKVAFGGTLVGLIVGWILIHWIKQVFDDPMFEITTIIAGSYLTFFLAENFFHVSGVLGLCALGVYCAAVGRTKFSPSVHHFLHEFWELAVFIANTLIFIIVGVVIAKRTQFTANDFIILGLVYLGLLMVRFIMLWLFYPIMRRIGYGVKPADIIVSWWGGLRGAIALALALVVAGNEKIHPDIRNQVLFLTAGIVMLTSLINATTMKKLIEWLGLARPTEDKRRMIQAGLSFVRQSGENAIEKLKTDRFMSGADWEAVYTYLPGVEQHESTTAASIAEMRKRLLQKEKSAYWELFEDGLVDGNAVLELSSAIDSMLDHDGTIPLSKRKDIEYLWKTPVILKYLQRLPVIGNIVSRQFFNLLSSGYDSARAFVHAQEETLKTLNNFQISIAGNVHSSGKTDFELLEDEINENKIQGLTFLRNLKESYPEIYRAIETRQAIRLLLNHEKMTVQRMAKQHRITEDEALLLEEMINEKIIRISRSTSDFLKSSPMDVLKKNNLFNDLDISVLQQILRNSQTMIYSVGEDIIKQGRPSEDIFILLRGTAKVTIDGELRDLLRQGDCFGETGMLTGLTRSGSVTAESPVTTLKISKTTLLNLEHKAPQLVFNLWQLAGYHITENILRASEKYRSMKLRRLRDWISDGELIVLSGGEKYDLNGMMAVCLRGKIADGSDLSSPLKNLQLLSVPSVIAEEKSWIYIFEQLPDAD